MNTFNPSDNLVRLVSKDATEWRAEADDYAHRVAGVSAVEAWHDVSRGGRGGLGTPFAKELKQLVFLAEIDSLPLAAE